MITKLAPASALCLVLLTCLTFAQVQRREVDIKALDGVILKASYLSPGKSGPAIILFHQCNMNRHAWDNLATDLVTAGFHVLTIDQRGFGASGGQRWEPSPELLPPPPPPPRPGQKPQESISLPTKVLENLNVAFGKAKIGDHDPAYAFLLSRAGVDKARIAAGGASCGVTEAAALASRHPEIKALLLLSGDASGFTSHIAATLSLAVFGSAARGDDPSSVRGIEQAVKASRNPRSLLQLYNGPEHGVAMFPKNPGLRPMIVRWLQEVLSPSLRMGTPPKQGDVPETLRPVVG